jgi:clan AA aspartic protease (TIGR02281 family)
MASRRGTVWIDVAGSGAICATLIAGWQFCDDITKFFGPPMHVNLASTSHAGAANSGQPSLSAISARPSEPLETAPRMSPALTYDEPDDGPIALAPILLPTIYRATRTGDTASGVRSNGQFAFRTEVNGAAIPMVFDTGAAVVALRVEDASSAGIDLGSLNYSVTVRTANGIALAAPIVIATLRVGSITRTNVKALVAKRGTLAVNLLGQSFLTSLAGYSVDGDRLVLRGD